jgi:hypothetical protein
MYWQSLQQWLLVIGCIGASWGMADRVMANELSAVVQFAGVVYPSCSVDIQQMLDQAKASNCHVQSDQPTGLRTTTNTVTDRASIVAATPEGKTPDYRQITIVPN